MGEPAARPAPAARAGRVVGVDLGSVRIGLASSDASGTLASPLTVLERSGDAARDHRAIVDAARERGARLIVVGLPLTLGGKVGPAAGAVLAEVAELAEVAGAEHIEVETWDERFTTVIADQGLRRGRDGRGRNAGRLRRQSMDAAAASVLLQSWLEAHA
jgi:putative Holliday junction resolvase